MSTLKRIVTILNGGDGQDRHTDCTMKLGQDTVRIAPSSSQVETCLPISVVSVVVSPLPHQQPHTVTVVPRSGQVQGGGPPWIWQLYQLVHLLGIGADGVVWNTRGGTTDINAGELHQLLQLLGVAA